MRVYRGLDRLPARRRPAAVTIGNFDGVHKGHLAVFRRLMAHASSAGAEPTVVTFDPHPQKVLRGIAPAALVTHRSKLELLEEAGIRQVVVVAFTRALSRVEPEDFIEQILVGALRAKAVVVGADHRFGRFARGDTTMLRTFGRRLGYSFEGVRLTELGGRLVSSTEIRHAVEEGDVGWANRALGRPHRVAGRIVRGKRRGAALGFPTANLRPPPGMCLPKIGIYAGYLVTGTRRMPSAVSVGTNPTFGANPVTIEAHVLGFEGDLYGGDAAIDFVQFIREERDFRGAAALTEAMRSDVSRVRRILGTAPS